MKYEQKKRVLDLVSAIFLAILFLPIWFVVPIMIYLDSGFPIIFKHKRVGLKGKEFHIYKFRSMVHDAENILHKHNKELLKKFRQGDWKLENDPRITKLGKALRSLTIDEFPQLYNVIKGEMSIIGPRAYVLKELNEQVKKYPKTKKYKKLILSVKPGITGPWQTSGRNEVPFTKRAKMDAEYAQNKSIKQDILIMLRTPKAMISKW